MEVRLITFRGNHGRITSHSQANPSLGTLAHPKPVRRYLNLSYVLHLHNLYTTTTTTPTTTTTIYYYYYYDYDHDHDYDYDYDDYYYY